MTFLFFCAPYKYSYLLPYLLTYINILSSTAPVGDSEDGEKDDDGLPCVIGESEEDATMHTERMPFVTDICKSLMSSYMLSEASLSSQVECHLILKLTSQF